MNIEEIMKTKEYLDASLRQALSSMDKKDSIPKIRELMKINQARCPHYSQNFQLTWVDNHCPYCGKQMEEQK